jgi:FkbH-like protein
MLTALSWLPPAPEDFRGTLRGLKRDVAAGFDMGGLWQRLRSLASHALDEVQLSQLARLVASLPEADGVPPRLKLGILGDGTLSLVGPAIVASALRRDLRVEIVEGAYGSAMNEAMDPSSTLRRAGLDAVLIACDRRGLGLDRIRASEADAEASVEAAFSTLRAIAENLRASVKGAILVQTIVPPPGPLFGSLDAVTSSSPYAQVSALNGRLARWAAEGNVVLIDTARLAASAGLERWDDPLQWHASKLPFSTEMIPLFGDFVARTLGAIRGKSHKCLVLDLDNTLWGGVIGDDGLEGIVLGQGSPTGEAFLAIQKMALDLRDRGVIIAVCSKNDEPNAWLPFREHSEMILKEDHVAVLMANWSDKASNLKTIAQRLNIGLDSLVFLDDNPAERAQVRAELPMVAVPELPSDPALYPRTLLAAGYFDAVSFNDDDRKRAASYQADSDRALLRAEASDMTAYLQSLAMTCTIRRFDTAGRARIAQLINKSNQFNLTTRRYTEAEVERIELDAEKHALQVRLADRFGDNGMISVVIADRNGDDWTIDTWLMSCRVLGRRVEEAVLASLAGAARAAGATRLIGRYIPTAKNGMVSEHYAKLGFGRIGEDEGGTTWELKLAEFAAPVLPMRIEDGFALVLNEAAE